MGFNELPDFPQGGVARAESGNQGIPPERFQQALLDQGIRLIADSKRPEDTPAVQAALGAEVDTLVAQMGHAPLPGSNQTQQAPQTVPGYQETQSQGQQAPAQADTARPSPQPPREFTQEAILRAMQKYESPEELAKAYLHTDAARTQAQQERAQELRGLRSTVENLQSEIRGLRSMAENIGSAPSNTTEADPTAGMTQEQAEAFWRNPLPQIRQTVDSVVRDHLLAYTDATAQYQKGVDFDQYRQQKAQEIAQMRPFLDQVYMEDTDLFESLEPKRSLDLLLKRAHERQDALRGRLFYEEMRQLQGGGNGNPGIPANAAPGQTGALPSQGSGMSRVVQQEPAPGGNWSNTRNMDRLWKSRSDSVDEMSAITDILKERGFGDIPIF